MGARSPLLAGKTMRPEEALPRFFTGLELPLSDVTRRRERDGPVSPERVEQLARELDAAGYWPAKLERISHPYRGPSPKELAPGDFSETEVGDEYDTSPYRSDHAPLGISTRVFVKNLFTLVRYVDENR